MTKGQPLSQKDRDAEWLKVYYKAQRDGLTRAELAEQINTTEHALQQKIYWFKNVRGITLPALASPWKKPALAGLQKNVHLAGDPSQKMKPLKNLVPEKEVSPEEIVRAWQTSNSYLEASEKTGLPIKSLLWRVARMKKRGVPFKKLKNQPIVNYDALKDLSLSLWPENQPKPILEPSEPSGHQPQ